VGLEHLVPGGRFTTYACGAAVAEVEVDGYTGMSRVRRVDIVHDVGNSLNPGIDRGQIEGGFVQGMGWLTSEDLKWDAKGRLLTHSASTYQIPAISDAPMEFNVTLLSNATQPNTIHGSKAVGEPPLMLAFSVREALRDAVASFGAAGGQVPLASPATGEAVWAEEVIPFVIDEDERREVLDLDLPDGFHAEFGELDDFDFLDVFLGEDGGGAADAAEVEAAVLLAGVGDLLAAISLGDHDHAAAVALEEIDVAVHAAGGGGAKAAAGHAGGCFGGAGVIDGVILEVVRQRLAGIEHLLQLRMRDVAGDDDGAVDEEARGGGILAQLGADLGHGAVRVDAHGVGVFAMRSSSGMYCSGFVSSFSMKTPSRVILPFAWRSAEHETPMPMGNDAP
jgi:hypothetical protein